MYRLPRGVIVFINIIIIKKLAMQLYYFIRVFFFSPIVVHRFSAAHTHLGIILLRYRSELSPSSVVRGVGGFLTPRSFLSPNPLHSPTTPRRSPRPCFSFQITIFFFHVSLTERYYIRFGSTLHRSDTYTHGLCVRVIMAERR